MVTKVSLTQNFSDTFIGRFMKPTLDSVIPPNNQLRINSSGGDLVSVVGENLVSDMTVILNGNEISATKLSNSRITFTAPAAPAGTYTLTALTPFGSYTSLPNVVLATSPATWVTASGSLGSFPISVPLTTTLSATGISTLTYTLQSGSLPTGLSLATDGTISGTPSALSTESFTVAVTDSNNNTSTRNFSMTVALPISSTGATVTTYGSYTIYSFTGSGTLSVGLAQPGQVFDILIVAGGGGGGTNTTYAGASGGGGAGGLLSYTSQTLTTGTFTVTVGGGGALGSSGQDSSFVGPSYSWTATGGGFGGYAATKSGNGGSSGGSAGNGSGANYGTAVAGQGYHGGNGDTVPAGGNACGGGGGGAGAVGVDGGFYGSPAGVGGAGLQNSIQTGSAQWYAAGGNGGGYGQVDTRTNGIGGGALNAGNSNGVTNTGSGGGCNYGAGGSGIVIVRISN